MEQCHSLKVLTLEKFTLDEDHCRVLGACSRPDLDLELKTCTLTSAGTSVLVDALGRNQGPTKLYRCVIDNFVLADGLRGNSRLTSYRTPLFCMSGEDDQNIQAIAGALRENKGLVDLELHYFCTVSHEAWDAVCDFLKTHPTLQVLSFIATIPDTTLKDSSRARLAPFALTQ
jgi:hypothetical protein